MSQGTLHLRAYAFLLEFATNTHELYATLSQLRKTQTDTLNAELDRVHSNNADLTQILAHMEMQYTFAQSLAFLTKIKVEHQIGHSK